MNSKLTAFSLLLIAACGGDSGGSSSQPDAQNQDSSTQAQPDAAPCVVTCEDLAKSCGVYDVPECVQPVDCGGCGDESICNEQGTCETVTATEGDIVGRAALITRRDYLGGICKPFASSKANVLFWEEQPPYADPRTELKTIEGENCLVGSALISGREALEFPLYIDDQYFPIPTYKDAGKVQMTVAGGTGTVVENPFQSGNGFPYAHEAPEELTDMGTTCSPLFDAAYTPTGSVFTVQTLGGTELGATDFGYGAIPKEFNVTNPDLSKEDTSIYFQNDLNLVWDNASPSTRMMVIVGDGQTEIVCDLNDDGQATIPKEAMKQLANAQSYLLQFMRRDRRVEKRAVGEKTVYLTAEGIVHVVGDVLNQAPKGPGVE